MEHVDILKPHPVHPVRPQLHPHLHGPGKIIPEGTAPKSYILHIPGIQGLHHQRIVPHPGKGVLHQNPPGTADIDPVGIPPAAEDLYIVHQHILAAADPQAPVVAVHNRNIPHRHIPALDGIHTPGINRPALIGITLHTDNPIPAHRHMTAMGKHQLAMDIRPLLQIHNGIILLHRENPHFMDTCGKTDYLCFLHRSTRSMGSRRNADCLCFLRRSILRLRSWLLLLLRRSPRNISPALRRRTPFIIPLLRQYQQIPLRAPVQLKRQLHGPIQIQQNLPALQPRHNPAAQRPGNDALRPPLRPDPQRHRLLPHKLHILHNTVPMIRTGINLRRPNRQPLALFLDNITHLSYLSFRIFSKIFRPCL